MIIISHIDLRELRHTVAINVKYDGNSALFIENIVSWLNSSGSLRYKIDMDYVMQNNADQRLISSQINSRC